MEKLLRARQPHEAMTQAKEMLELVPRSTRVHFYLGNALIAAQRIPEAATPLRLRPDLAYIWINLVQCNR